MSEILEHIEHVELDKDRKVWPDKANKESKSKYTIHIQLLKHKEQLKLIVLVERQHR